MFEISSLKTFVAGVLLASCSVAAHATVLWDQSPDPSQPDFVDQVFPDFPAFSTFMVSDVVFSTDVTIETVTTYFTNRNVTWPQGGTGPAILNIFADDGSLDTEDPSTGISVTAAYSAGASGLELLASGLSIDLLAGTYWIGLTPVLDSSLFGQEFHQAAASLLGVNTQARNPGGGFGVGIDWVEAGPAFVGVDYDAAITITGEEARIPVPATLALLVLGLAGIGYQRRKQLEAA